MRLASYCRVSTQEQADEGKSLHTQEQRIRAYCAQHGHELVALHSDDGISGKVPPHKRPGLHAALEAIRRGDADGLIAYKLDRVSRSIRNVIDLVEAAERRGWALISVSESIDTKSAMGRMFVHLLAMLGQLERELIGERTKDAMAQLARDGKRRSRFAPLGYTIDGDNVVPNATEQPIVSTIAAIRSQGHGPRAIARTLNENGIRNPRTHGLWAPSTVAAILRTMARRAV